MAALTATLPLLLGAAGCTDDTALEPNPGTTKPAAATQKAAAPPARLTTATFVPATLAAYAKVKSWTGVMRISTGGQVITATITQTYQPAAVRIDLSGPQFDGASHGILTKGAMYLYIPDPKLRGKYLRFDPKRTKHPVAAVLAPLLESLDPAKSTKAMRKAVVRVKFVSSGTIGFRKVDRYDVTLTNAVMLRALGMKVPAGLPKTSVMSTWIGADRLSYKQTSSSGSSQTQVTTTGYNTGVTIALPPASKVLEKP
ncbi:hypothetical protein [Kribbella sp. CA-294648]|uniref:hypothetical protein n=1 Tax=Kribbella sp. CA-294648 TaxID=3239948 RepID=UPI003D8C97B8